jgi:hypothetical protein
MPSGKDLKRIERQMFASYFQDGLWDIMIGMLMMAIAIRSFIDHWSVSLIGIIGVIFVILMRKFVTMKRIGYARFGSRRKKRRVTMFLIILGTNLFTLLLLVITIMGVEPSALARAVVVGSLVLVSFSAIAFLLDFWRFFIWGSLFAFSLVVTEFTGVEIGKYIFLAVGSSALIIGLVYLFIFLRRYPGSKEGSANAA